MKPSSHRTLLCALVAGLLLSLGASAADKGKKSKKTVTTDNPDPSGRFAKYDSGQPRRFVLWHDEKGWHLRTTTAKEIHRFHGVIEVVDGRILSITNFGGLEGKGKARDRGVINPMQTAIAFDFKTGNREDGFDFRVSPKATKIRFKLRIDGYDHPDRIFIGRKGDHPREAIFALPAHPDK